MRRLLPVLVLLSACAQGVMEPGEPPEDPVPPETTTTIIVSVTTTTVTTTTTSRTTPAGPARFALTEVIFGESGFIEITNLGDGPGELTGHWLCRFPAYFPIPDLELGAGESVWVAIGDGEGLEGPIGPATVVPARGALGTLRPQDGEVGLYRSRSFGDPEAIVSYLEWGSTPHGRTGVAVQAGIWTEGDFVEVPPDAFGLVATERPPLGAGDWMAQVGG